MTAPGTPFRASGRDSRRYRDDDIGRAITPAAVRRRSISSRNAATRSSDVLRPSSSMWSSACWRLLVVIFRRSSATMRVGFRNVLQAAPFHQPYCRIDDRFRGKSVGGTVLQPKNVAGQVEGADLAAAVGEELVAANRAVDDLVDIVGRLRLAKDLRAPVVFEFAQDYPCARKLAELPRAFGLLPGWALTLTNMDLSLFETICSHPRGPALANYRKLNGWLPPGLC